MYSLYVVPLYIYSGFKIVSPNIDNIIFGEKLPNKPNVNIDNYKKLDLGMRAVLFNNNTAINHNLSSQTKVKVSEEDWRKYNSKLDKVSKKKSLIIME